MVLPIIHKKADSQPRSSRRRYRGERWRQHDNTLFTATLSNGRQSVFVERLGEVSVVATTANPLDGKAVTSFEIGADGLSGSSAAFKVNFTDGSKAIYRAEMVDPQL